jgi:hypothetical protein
MDHRLVTAIEKAFGWDGPAALGTALTRGHIEDAELLPRLLTGNRLLDLIMRRHLANPQLRMYAEGQVLHPSAFLTNFVSRRQQASRRADMAAVGRILDEGGTAILDTVNMFDPTLEVACRALGWWTGELVSVNAYLAVGDTAGFSTHWDDHDVLCVQLAGQKSWEVRGPSRPHPMYRDAEQNLEPPDEVLWAGTVQPGDVMHIPRGFWHAATRVGSGDGLSLHLTFGITRRTGVTWIQALADTARADELFRTDLEPPGGHDRDLLIARLAELALDFDPGRYLDRMRANTPAARHLPYVPALGPLTGAVTVTEYEPMIVEDDVAGTVTVTAAGKSLTFARRAAPDVRLLLSGHPVQLSGGTPDLHLLAEHLVKEGLCAPLTDESLSGYTGLVPVASCWARRSNSA